MRDLLISATLVLLVVGSWLYFNHYSTQTVTNLINTIEKEVIVSAESEEWEQSISSLSNLKNEWEDYKKWALLFLSSKEISEIDYSLSRTAKYIDSEDISNSTGELNSTAEQMRFIITREEPSWKNIF